MSTESNTKLRALLRTIPNFPKPGINFYDVTTLMRDAEGFSLVTAEFAERYGKSELDAIVGIDARGFIFGAALAERLKLGFIPVRKAGKLPAEVERISYSLEYGESTLEIHRDALKPGQRVVVVDDLLATGGTARAAVDLVQKIGAHVEECAFVIELSSLRGRAKLEPSKVYSILDFKS